MIRLLLNERLSERSFKAGRRIEWKEVAEATGIHRTTLSRMLNQRGYNATTSNLDSLCRYFECTLAELAIYIPDEQVEVPVEKSFKGPKPAGGRSK